eukprot:NODE_196_length_13278_cov_0.565217.p4 type:complete len:146 gc:universal NODE_196_length_13278_cov_0.565217:1079-642(-)
MEIYTTPFKHGIVKNPIDDSLMEAAYREMKSLNFNDNSNDLYHFKQATKEMLMKKDNLKPLLKSCTLQNSANNLESWVIVSWIKLISPHIAIQKMTIYYVTTTRLKRESLYVKLRLYCTLTETGLNPMAGLLIYLMSMEIGCQIL